MAKTAENAVVIDGSSLTVEKMIKDTRPDWVGRPRMHETFTLAENGDIYVYCLGSFGYVPGQHQGFYESKMGKRNLIPTMYSI